jgi:Tfp pilus assembly protein PilZ
MVEGQVARVHRVSLALRHVEQPGVGVRFLSPGELVQDLLGNKNKVANSSAPAPSAPAPDGDAAAPAPSPASVAAAPVPPSAAPTGTGRQLTVEFVDRTSFLNIYHRDIASGGLFVTSAEPARMHELVIVELRPPIAIAHPLRFEARVVHCVEGGVAGTGAPRGMGVQFLDPDRVRAALAPIVLELRR